MSFFDELTNHILSGAKVASEDTQKERMDICSLCEFFDKGKMKCKSCGCYLNIKTAWESSKCPENKW